MGQYFEDCSENDGAILRDISSSRREAAKTEKDLNDTLLSTAKAEEKAKEDIWKMKKETAEYELKMAKMQAAAFETQNYTNLIRRNIAIIEYNRLGNNVPVPNLPPAPSGWPSN